MLAGDFNALLRNDEKQGDSCNGSAACNLFNKFFNDCCLKDIDFQGFKFTWSRGSVFERFDRALCNLQWESLAPNTIVTHLHKIKSDHRSLAINFGCKLVPKVVRPFRFLSSWLSHEGFRGFVFENWVRKDHMQGTVS